MWQKFRKREEAIKVYYKDKGEPARDHLPRTAVDGVISWEPVSMHWNIIWSLHLETMPCWVWLQVCQRKERSCQDVIIPPPPPHPPASGDDAMLSVAASVSGEGTHLPGRYYPTPPHPTPPHLETMPCWVWLQVWQRKERSCQDVIIPPHPTASGDDAMLSVATSVSKEGTQLPGRYSCWCLFVAPVAPRLIKLWHDQWTQFPMGSFWLSSTVCAFWYKEAPKSPPTLKEAPAS